MSFYSIYLLFFSDPDGGGASEGSAPVPSGGVTLDGETMQISGEDVSIQGAEE